MILRRQVAARDGRGHVGDVADLAGEVGGHGVDVVGEILPGARHAGHLRLAAELAVGADLARHAADFAGEGAELIDHRVDGFLQLQNLAAHVDGDLLGKVAVGHGDGHLGDVADLAGEVVGHGVDVVGEILPRAGHAGHRRLAAELALGADLARHAAHFAGEGVELIDHRVDRVLQLQNFALHLDGDLAERSPWATAVVTSAMLRTWPVRLEAMKFTLSVRSFQVPATPGTAPGRRACPRCRLRGPRGVTSEAKPLS